LWLLVEFISAFLLVIVFWFVKFGRCALLGLNFICEMWCGRECEEGTLLLGSFCNGCTATSSG
jgi:hypothetical protein